MEKQPKNKPTRGYGWLMAEANGNKGFTKKAEPFRKEELDLERDRIIKRLVEEGIKPL